MVGGRVKGAHTFPNGISPKVSVIVRPEIELAYYNVAVQPLRYEDFHDFKSVLIRIWLNAQLRHVIHIINNYFLKFIITQSILQKSDRARKVGEESGKRVSQ